MKISVKVIESESVQHDFWINCGEGNQFVSWLANTACLEFSQVHYPKGIYVPNLLTVDNNAVHPR